MKREVLVIMQTPNAIQFNPIAFDSNSPFQQQQNQFTNDEFAQFQQQPINENVDLNGSEEVNPQFIAQQELAHPNIQMPIQPIPSAEQPHPTPIIQPIIQQEESPQIAMPIEAKPLMEREEVIQPAPIITKLQQTEEIHTTSTPTMQNSWPEVLAQSNQEMLLDSPNLGKTYYPIEIFSKFIDALDIIKLFKQSVIFNEGVAYFVGDNRSILCRFDMNLQNQSTINFMVPRSEQQAKQLTFLTSNKNDSKKFVLVVESKDDYVFSNGAARLLLRKCAPDKSIYTKDDFDKRINTIKTLPKLFELNFTSINGEPSSELSSFLNMFKITSNPSIDLTSSKDGKLLYLTTGEPNSGKFSLLNGIPCDPNLLGGKNIQTNITNNMVFSLGFTSLAIDLYYDCVKNSDRMFLMTYGILNGGYAIEILHSLYTNVNDIDSTRVSIN